VINLQGRLYATYPAVLNRAHEAGLQALRTQILQIPGEENGHVAIVQATAVFADGREFADIGDACPENCGPKT